MQFKTELHAHTSEVSPCGHVTAPEVAERFIAEGYTSLVITNHYCDYVIDTLKGSWQEKMDYYMYPYHLMREHAGDRLNVILGCELRFEGNINDYLIYGITEDFLRENPDLHKMSLRSFAPLARENGFLVVQAHPFRNEIQIVPPALLDGMETFNGTPSYDGRNSIADAWAKRYNLIRTSGSDFHNPDQHGTGGILTSAAIRTGEELVAVLKSGNYTLHCEGPAAEREGITDYPAKY
ncbi:MAG: PHP domain-containing protein [Clostridia bacterium]|nr:PHP domain-containing protein [Clostridia bacterium]